MRKYVGTIATDFGYLWEIYVRYFHQFLRFRIISLTHLYKWKHERCFLSVFTIKTFDVSDCPHAEIKSGRWAAALSRSATVRYDKNYSPVICSAGSFEIKKGWFFCNLKRELRLIAIAILRKRNCQLLVKKHKYLVITILLWTLNRFFRNVMTQNFNIFTRNGSWLRLVRNILFRWAQPLMKVLSLPNME